MTYKLDDDRRKLITEKLLGECWHCQVEDRPGIIVHLICACGKGFLSYDAMKYHLGSNRTFNNDTDMMAIYRAIYKNGEWGRFIKWMIRKGLHGILEMTSDNWCLLSSEDAAWLFCLDELEYEARCWLVAEWMKEVEK